ncbi:AIM24 family protein, partial [Candidatus Nomurabacteria bacterium]|nr:AIM24 family protein [Candidatus Nomurabacteria bacterium]
MKYQIIGEPLPVVICELNEGESMISERGSMCWMTPNMKMETTSGGGVGKAIGRMFAGEALFQNRYTAMNGSGSIAFASSFPGSVREFTISPGNEMIVQKSAYLAGEPGVVL